MTGKDILYIGATLAGGFVAFKIYRAASSAVAAGASVGNAIVSGAKSVVTEDLNPMSPKNIVYSGTSKVVSAVTGRDESLGTWLYGIFNDEPDINAPVTHSANDTYDAYDYQGKPPLGAAAVTYNKPQAIQETAQTSFRLSELNSTYTTKFDNFLNTLARQ